MKNINDFLIKANNKQIANLTMSSDKYKIYNVLNNKCTKPNSKDRIHWIKYCNIIQYINKLPSKNSNIYINFYMNDLNHEIYHSSYQNYGRNNINKILYSIWEYINIDNICLPISENTFGLKDIYNHYMYIHKNEIKKNVYISKILFNIDKSKLSKKLSESILSINISVILHD